ncbi:MAG: NAD(P)/FAD-dependent oxidoreductase [Pseudomonadota bacterium]
MTTTNFTTDAVVIGAGVIGLAIARALALKGLETIVLEQASHIGSETSSRNSEVIHAGIYYPPGSLKARLCVRGKALLYDYLETHQIAHARCGKLIVATSAHETMQLDAIAQRAVENGVNDLRYLSKSEVAELEPEVEAERALLSPSTGIVDSHQLMLSLQGELESAGGNVALSTALEKGRLSRRGPHVLMTGGPNTADLRCRYVVNASGLHARETYRKLLDGLSDTRLPEQFFAKGHYYAYPGKAPFKRLVYPVPAAGGLGVHATVDLAGQVRFGPDVRWVHELDYQFDDSRRDEFTRAISHYYPAIDKTRLQPGYTGIRPKVVAEGEPDGDFVVLTERDHGYSGFISLHGMESPGLTACMAIAEQIADKL